MPIQNWFYLRKNAPNIQRQSITSPSDTYVNLVDVNSPTNGNIISVSNFASILPAGPAGPQGVQGPAGPIGPVGPAGLNWQGAWSTTGAYVADDAVGYAGASWFCLNPVGPSILAPDVDTTNWALLASQGAQGPQGVQGPTGPQGASAVQLYTKFVGSITQIGASAPSINFELENDLGTASTQYVSAGIYTLTFTSLAGVPADKVAVFIQNGTSIFASGGSVEAWYDGNDYILIRSYNSSGVLANNPIYNASIEVRIYS